MGRQREIRNRELAEGLGDRNRREYPASVLRGVVPSVTRRANLRFHDRFSLSKKGCNAQPLNQYFVSLAQALLGYR